MRIKSNENIRICAEALKMGLLELGLGSYFECYSLNTNRLSS